MLLVAGCATVGPAFERPETTVADDWLEVDDARVDTAKVEYQQWWSMFDDPVLTRLIDTAYQQNPGLQVAGLRILEARAHGLGRLPGKHGSTRTGFKQLTSTHLSLSQPKFPIHFEFHTNFSSGPL